MAVEDKPKNSRFSNERGFAVKDNGINGLSKTESKALQKSKIISTFGGGKCYQKINLIASQIIKDIRYIKWPCSSYENID